MKKILSFLILFISYLGYSSWVYTGGTENGSMMNDKASMGKELWQQHNCMACHQIFGLGGYLGPELTTVISDSSRGEQYARILLEKGGTQMPDFKFEPRETDAIIEYLKYIDSNAFSYKPVKH
ncbi:MAG: cytochrome c [Ferruginibacter sp.]